MRFKKAHIVLHQSLLKGTLMFEDMRFQNQSTCPSGRRALRETFIGGIKEQK